jgi:RNA polymerase sigma-70 factor (ECF subfamily)
MNKKNYPEDDSSLIELCEQGDSHAFVILYNKHKTNLFRYFKKLYGNEDDANDLMQEVLFKAMNAIRIGLYKNNNFPGWLTTIGYNYFINDYRKSKKNPVAHPNDFSQIINGKELSPEQIVIESENSLIFRKKVDSLPLDLKNAMDLWLDDTPYVEASQKLKIKLGTYKSRAFFAKKALKKYYI